MKQMTWEDYYEGFYDWSPSTQKNYTYRLSDYGPADEVWEGAQELAFQDEAFAAKFLEKVLAAGAPFVSLSRALICQPDFVERMEKGQTESPCLACNHCYNVYRQRPVRCVLHTEVIPQLEAVFGPYPT